MKRIEIRYQDKLAEEGIVKHSLMQMKDQGCFMAKDKDGSKEKRDQLKAEYLEHMKTTQRLKGELERLMSLDRVLSRQLGDTNLGILDKIRHEVDAKQEGSKQSDSKN